MGATDEILKTLKSNADWMTTTDLIRVTQYSDCVVRSSIRTLLSRDDIDYRRGEVGRKLFIRYIGDDRSSNSNWSEHDHWRLALGLTTAYNPIKDVE